MSMAPVGSARSRRRGPLPRHQLLVRIERLAKRARLIEDSITQWYRRHECGLRMSIFFSMATVAGAFGGLLARGISEMDGIRGIGGWGWIFILEGMATVLVAIWAYWAFHDYPDTVVFLTERERQEIARRLDSDRGSLAAEYDRKYLWQAFEDLKVWVHCFNFLG